MAVSATALCLHGAVVNGAQWIPLARRLPELRVVAPDLPGHGARRAEPFTLARALDGVVAVARATPAPVILVGDSLGGYLALLAAARLGDAIAGVVAGGCAFAFDGWRRSAALATLAPEGLALRLLGERRVRHLLRAGVRRALAREPGVADAVLARGLAPRARSATLRALLDAQILAALGAIRAPVLYVDGALDPAAIDAPRFLARTPRARRIVVPRCGHGVSVTRPDAVAAAVRSLS